LQQQREHDTTLFPTPAVSLETLLAHFKGYYDNPTRPLTEAQYQEGRTILTRYWEAHRGHFPIPYLLEEKFSLHVGPFLIGGRIDRVDETPDGYEIVDYKLSQPRFIRPDPLQLDIYQLGLREKTGQVAKKLSFYYLRTGETESIEADSPTGAQTRVRALCRDINREQEFRPHEGAWCTTCDFQEFCPVKAKTPRPVPTNSRLQQLGFDF
jgi:RecB family exonuclease